MINFHSITVEARDLFNVFHNPVEIYIDEEGEIRDIEFQEGDCVDVFLTDGSQFLLQYEQEEWVCRQFISANPRLDPLVEGELVTVLGRYRELEEALNHLISRKNYLTLN